MVESPMFERTIAADDLARVKGEREDADRVYNDALTALDDAIQRLRELPHPPPPYDESQITSLNERWELLSLKPAGRGGWRGWLRARVWAVVAQLFERQQAFNAALVDHVNRNVATHREAARAIASTLTVFQEELEKLVAFQSKLVVYAQQITPYVNTKDYELATLMHHISGAISGVSDELQKRWESTAARLESTTARLESTTATLGVVQRASQTLKRELERRRASDEVSAPRRPSTRSTGSGSTVSPVEPSTNSGRPESVEGHSSAAEQPTPVAEPAASSLDAFKYVGFEDRFRGSRLEIRARMTDYVPYFVGATDVLDLGCGRGEFLDLLVERGIPARGVDVNDEMAAICRDRGLDATSADALSYLLAQPDASLGGLFAAQVVEHFEPDYLMRLLDVAYDKLRPGSKIILETINPACWYAFFSSYIRDITHIRPLHPDTLQYLLEASGFQRVEIRYSAPYPDEAKLQPVPSLAGRAAAGDADGDRLSAMEAVLNNNVITLNRLLFTYLDYAAVGERP